MSTSPDESEDVRAFGATLPESYRRNFDLVAIAAHSKIARERESAPANVGSFFSSRVPGSAVCVVADDRPGLLATISAALVLCGLDVIEAEAYTRRVVDKTNEAVDVLSGTNFSASNAGNGAIEHLPKCREGRQITPPQVRGKLYSQGGARGCNGHVPPEKPIGGHNRRVAKSERTDGLFAEQLRN